MNISTATVILGTTCAGKTSSAKILSEKYGFNVIDVDQEARKIKEDIFINRDEKFLQDTFESINERVLKMKNVIYTTSILTPQRIKEFHNNGFKIIHLYAGLDELIRRRTIRHGGFLSQERLARVKKNYQDHMAIANDPQLSELITLTVDTTKLTPEETLSKILESLE